MSGEPITALLHQWRSGDQSAAERLLEIVYSELHGIAQREMRREAGGHTLQTTALVNEAYLRLAGSAPMNWHDRAHFFAIAARQMRWILVDHARRIGSEKRGGRLERVDLWDSDGRLAVDHRVLAVNEALERLSQLDQRAAEVVELRFFGGLNEEESAEALGISVATLKRDWSFARAWLASQLQS